MRIYIISLDFENEELVDRLALSLKKVFGVPISNLTIDIDLKEGWSFESNQLNSGWVLSQMREKVPNEDCKLLGVTVYDLFTPIMTYLFGEAELGGKAALFSMYRFQDDIYGLPKNDSILEKRIYKEAIHELGHTFGMVHCRNYNCVMHSSASIEEFDYKTDNFCESCALHLKEKMQV